MVRRETDLILAVLCSLALVAVAVAPPPATPARGALGVPFVLVLPGWVLTAALFPHRTDLDFLERTALSVGLSAAIIPLLGLALNYSPWGIRPHPIVLSVMLFTLLVAAVAAGARVPPSAAHPLATPAADQHRHQSVGGGRGPARRDPGSGGRLSPDP